MPRSVDRNPPPTPQDSGPHDDTQRALNPPIIQAQASHTRTRRRSPPRPPPPALPAPPRAARAVLSAPSLLLLLPAFLLMLVCRGLDPVAACLRGRSNAEWPLWLYAVANGQSGSMDCCFVEAGRCMMAAPGAADASCRALGWPSQNGERPALALNVGAFNQRTADGRRHANRKHVPRGPNFLALTRAGRPQDPTESKQGTCRAVWPAEGQPSRAPARMQTDTNVCGGVVAAST